jgi:hypothetical protein
MFIISPIPTERHTIPITPLVGGDCLRPMA